jgi:hypothetical protein
MQIAQQKTAIFHDMKPEPQLFFLGLKALLHLQFLLRFSSSDGCEQVDKLIVMNVQMMVHILRTLISCLLVHIQNKKKIALEIAAKIASVNRP